jgi:hypothetical protein
LFALLDVEGEGVEVAEEVEVVVVVLEVKTFASAGLSHVGYMLLCTISNLFLF